MKSVFEFNEFGDHTECIIRCYTLAGGRSNLSDAMYSVVDMEADKYESPLFDRDIDALIDRKLVSVFRRDAYGYPVLESFVIKNLLENAADKVGGRISVYTKTAPERVLRSAKEFMEGVSVEEYNIPILNANGERAKAGKFVPVRFRDQDSGEQEIRYVEVFEDVTLKFTINSLRKTDDWPMIWKVAEDLGVGAARNHGYGKFVVVSWGAREAA